MNAFGGLIKQLLNYFAQKLPNLERIFCKRLLFGKSDYFVHFWPDFLPSYLTVLVDCRLLWMLICG